MYKTQEQIAAENLEIADRLSANFGKAILKKVKSDYARYDLDVITQDLKAAQEHGLLFDVSRGPEVLGFITPDEVIERFAKDENFRDYYNLVTPAYAIEVITNKLEEDAKYFTTEFTPEIQEERKAVFEQAAASLTRMRDRISSYGHIDASELLQQNAL